MISLGSENGLWLAAVIGLVFMAVVPLSLLLIVSVAAKRRPHVYTQQLPVWRSGRGDE